MPNLKLSTEELELFNDICDFQDKYVNLYFIKKRSGKLRKIIEPNEPYKELQRKLYNFLLENNIFRVSDVSYAWHPGRNRIMCASKHIGQQYVAELDIKDFFPSITEQHVYNLLTDYNIDRIIDVPIERLVIFLTYYKSNSKERFLPMGYVTSPLLANAIRYPIDIQIKDICDARGITYTVYGDNLFFSGNYLDYNFLSSIITLLASYGFIVKRNKVKIMPYYTSQRVLSIVVNRKLSIPKEYYHETIKEILDKLKSGEKVDASLYGKVNVLKLADNKRNYRFAIKLLSYCHHNKFRYKIKYLILRFLHKILKIFTYDKGE